MVSYNLPAAPFGPFFMFVRAIDKDKKRKGKKR